MKRKRHALILELIQQYEITTQDELLAKLRENGFEVTQATVSRDIKELRLVKAMSPSGQYRYMAGAAQGDEYLAKFYTIFSGSVWASSRGETNSRITFSAIIIVEMS